MVENREKGQTGGPSGACQDAEAAGGMLKKLELGEINPGTGWAAGEPDHNSLWETKARQGRALPRATE